MSKQTSFSIRKREIPKKKEGEKKAINVFSFIWKFTAINSEDASIAASTPARCSPH